MKKAYVLLFALLIGAWAVKAQTYNVTLQVDMSQVTAADTVSAAGNFQVAAGYPSDWTPGSTILTDANMDGVYDISITLPAGSYEYKFLNGTAWGTDEGVPGACAVNGNRGMTISSDTTISVVCFGLCDPCPTSVDTLWVVMAVDMRNEMQTGAVDTVSVAGSFQAAALDSAWGNWSPGATILRDADGDSIYTTAFFIPEGTYAYKYVNGVAWGSDESVPSACAVSGNREMMLDGNPGDTVYVGPVCFEECTMTCPVLLPPVNVTFRVDMSNEIVNASGLFVAGSFQDPQWVKNSIQLTDPDMDDIYEVTVSIKPGEYGFKYFNGTNGDPASDMFSETADFCTLGCGNCDFGNNRKLDLAGLTHDTIVPSWYYNDCLFSNGGSTDIADDLNANGGFTIYPNPFSDFAVVEFSNDVRATYSLSVLNVAGQEVRRISGITGHSVVIKKEDLAPGLYFVRLENQKGESYSAKMMVK